SKNRSGRERADRKIRRRRSIQGDARGDEGGRLQNLRSAQSALRKRSREMVSRKNADHPSGAHRRPARRDRSLHILAGANRSRRLAETARDTLAWFKSQGRDRQAKLRGGITAEREAEVLTAWKKQKAGSS